MGSAPNVFATLREQLKGSGAEVLTPDSPGYAESIKRWSEHCEKKAVSVMDSFYHSSYPWLVLFYLRSEECV